MLHYELSNIVIGFVIWLPVVYLGVALAEYVAHRWVMHRNTMLTKAEFEKHAVQHHARRVMEPRYPYVDLALHCHLIYGAPAWGGFLISFLCGRPYALGGLIATLTMFTFHSYVWSKLHRAQHDLEDNWTCRLPWFAELKRHHLDHHIRPSRNFAAMFLWTDRLFGTYWRSAEACAVAAAPRHRAPGRPCPSPTTTVPARP